MRKRDRYPPMSTNGRVPSGNLFNNSLLLVSDIYVMTLYNSILMFKILIFLLTEVSVNHIPGLFIFLISGNTNLQRF